MKEEKLHHGQCRRLLIVRGYTSSSSNCMEGTATAYTDGQGSNYYMYGWRGMQLYGVGAGYMRRTGSNGE